VVPFSQEAVNVLGGASAGPTATVPAGVPAIGPSAVARATGGSGDQVSTVNNIYINVIHPDPMLPFAPSLPSAKPAYSPNEMIDLSGYPAQTGYRPVSPGGAPPAYGAPAPGFPGYWQQNGPGGAGQPPGTWSNQGLGYDPITMTWTYGPKFQFSQQKKKGW